MTDEIVAALAVLSEAGMVVGDAFVLLDFGVIFIGTRGCGEGVDVAVIARADNAWNRYSS